MRWPLHQWIRSAIRDSQQPTSPIGFLFLKLPPLPCAVLLVPIPPNILRMRKSGKSLLTNLFLGDSPADLWGAVPANRFNGCNGFNACNGCGACGSTGCNACNGKWLWRQKGTESNGKNLHLTMISTIKLPCIRDFWFVGAIRFFSPWQLCGRSRLGRYVGADGRRGWRDRKPEAYDKTCDRCCRSITEGTVRVIQWQWTTVALAFTKTKRQVQKSIDDNIFSKYIYMHVCMHACMHIHEGRQAGRQAGRVMYVCM